MSLKDALLKAGLKSSKSENDRAFKPQREKKKVEKHQEHRNFCEVCNTVQPDVERFKHRMPTVDGEWICANCADKEEILDQFRVTNQSEFARTRQYRRYYGPMKDFSKEGLPSSKGGRNHRHSGQQGNRRQENRPGNQAGNRGNSRKSKNFNR